MFISGLPLNGWARQPFIAEGLGPEGIYSQTIVYLFLRPLFLFFFNGHSHCPNKGVRHYYLANCHRFADAVRSRHARGASASWARGDDNQGEKNDFLRFQEQLLRRKKQKLFLGVSVGNGVRGGLFLQAKGKWP